MDDPKIERSPDHDSGRGETDMAPMDTSFDVQLDDEPETMPEPSTREEVILDATVRDAVRLPIVPAHLRGPNLRKTVERTAGAQWHRARFHGVRIPIYAPLGLFWAVVGLFRLAGRQLSWWWHPELSSLMQHAANVNDMQQGANLHHKLSAARKSRGVVLLGEVLVLAVALTVVVTLAPGWVMVLVVVLVVPPLAHLGRPVNQPIVTAAVIAPRFRRLTLDVVLRAYYAAGLGHADKRDQQVTFAPPGAAVDGDGSRVVVDLPYGRGYDDVLAAKGKIASGLDVSVNQVFLTPDKSSHRRHILWVAHQDPLAIPAGHTELLDGKMRDVWQPAPFGLDERGNRVALSLLFKSFLIGAQPRKGKTFSARLIALFAALDPHTVICGADGKLSPDWNSFPLVAHRWVFGTHPNPRDRDPLGHLMSMLIEVEAHISEINEFLSTLPKSECPEGVLTRELSRKYARLRVWLLIIEEFQLYFETEDQDYNKEIAKRLSNILATGPSAGVVLISSSQKPSGVGAGDVARLFNRYRDNHGVRFALKCGNRVVSEAILGGDAYSEGFDASSLPVGDEYRGIGFLYGASDHTPCVRTYLADAQDSEHILKAARAHRERLGMLTGSAAGEHVARSTRDPLADVRSIWVPAETGQHWGTLAARLAEALPGSYADLTAEALSATLRGLGVPSDQVKVDGVNRAGFYLKNLDAVIAKKSLGR